MLDLNGIREFGYPDDPYLKWADGFLTDHQALRELCMSLGELERELEPLSKEREALRTRIADIVARQDGPVEIRGFGVVRITAPSVTKGYDKDAVKALAAPDPTEPDGWTRGYCCSRSKEREVQAVPIGTDRRAEPPTNP